jgi:glycosyltransferase involved in cell wall biosynthesis
MTSELIVVMPAYNAALTLERTYRDLPKDRITQVIVVDDASQDDTVAIARRLGLRVIVHAQNRGYGANQKTCYLEALSAGADIVVMVHPDYQYDARLVPELVQPIIDGRYDLMLGSRLLGGGPLAGGMPLYKLISNRFLTIVENWVLGQRLSECHTGFRAYRRELLLTIPFVLNADDFSFDTEVIAQSVAFGFRIGEIGVPTRYFREASSVNLGQGIVYGLKTLDIMLAYALDRWHVRRYPGFHRKLVDVMSDGSWRRMNRVGQGEA